MAYSDSIKLTMSSSEEIGKAIQKQRRAQKITQKEFAQRLGKSDVLSRNMNLVKYC